jgi:hypothetical protein
MDWSFLHSKRYSRSICVRYDLAWMVEWGILFYMFPIVGKDNIGTLGVSVDRIIGVSTCIPFITCTWVGTTR